MPYDSADKNRYSCDEPRNLSRGREYKSFQPLSALAHFVPGGEAWVESFPRFGDRVIRIPTAAQPLIISLLPREGEGPAEDPRAGLICEHNLHIKRAP